LPRDDPFSRATLSSAMRGAELVVAATSEIVAGAGAGQLDRDDTILHLPSSSAPIALVDPRPDGPPASATGSTDHRTRGEWPNRLVALF